MYLSNEEMKLLRLLMKYDIMSSAEIEEEGFIRNIKTLQEKGLVKRTFAGERYSQDQYIVIGISKEWQKCLYELFEKVK